MWCYFRFKDVHDEATCEFYVSNTTLNETPSILHWFRSHYNFTDGRTIFFVRLLGCLLNLKRHVGVGLGACHTPIFRWQDSTGVLGNFGIIVEEVRKHLSGEEDCTLSHH